MQVQVSDHDLAVMSVLLAHPGRLLAPSELAAAAWDVHAGDWIVELAATIERLQEWLEHQPERLEAVETDDTLCTVYLFHRPVQELSRRVDIFGFSPDQCRERDRSARR